MNPIGINLAEITYYGTQLPFKNFALMGDKWYSEWKTWKSVQDTRVIPLTKTGYPAKLEADQVCKTLIFVGNGGNYPAGQYKLSWSGDGECIIKGVGITVVSTAVPNQIVYNVTPNANGLYLYVNRVNPADPIRHIRLSQSDGIFTDHFLADVGEYNVLRFMDWGRTNGSNQVVWVDRSEPEDCSYYPNGVPYETMIDLCNQTKSDPWICIPHKADNNYVTQLVTLVKNNLSSGLKLWLEYSNECWNGGFAQFQFCQNVLRPLYNAANSQIAYGKRMAEIFAITKPILGDSLVRVLGYQTANTWTLSQSIQGAITGNDLPVDVFAGAPYFAFDVVAVYQQYLAGTYQIDDDTFAALIAGIDKVMNGVKAGLVISHQYNKQLVSYEGGQHLTPSIGPQHNDAGFVKLLADINRDSRMGDCYKYYLDRWYVNSGGGLMCHYADTAPYNKWGYWGLHENYNDKSVKHTTLHSYFGFPI